MHLFQHSNTILEVYFLEICKISIHGWNSFVIWFKTLSSQDFFSDSINDNTQRKSNLIKSLDVSNLYLFVIPWILPSFKHLSEHVYCLRKINDFSSLNQIFPREVSPPTDPKGCINLNSYIMALLNDLLFSLLEDNQQNI